MAIYILVEFFLLIFLLKRKKYRFEYSLASFGLMLQAMTRSNQVGMDIPAYFVEYRSHGAESWKAAFTNSEYAFSVYCKFLNSLGLKERGFLVVTAILFAALLAVAIKANHCDGILTLSLYYFTGLYIQSFCIIRQSLSIAIVLIAVSSMKEALKRRKIPWKYLFGLVIAAGFHPTALVFAVLPVMIWFYGRKKCMKPWMFLRDGVLFMLLILGAFSWLFPFVLQHTTSKYASLYGGSYVSGTFGNLKGGLLLLVLYLVFYLAFWNNWRRLTQNEYLVVGSTVTLAFTFASLSIASSTLGRMNLFVEGLMVLMLDKLMRDRYKKYTSVNFYIVLFFCLYFVLYLMRDSIGVVPYRLM